MNKDTWTRTKKIVAARDGGKCLKCLGEATDIHHRIPRGMGGTSDPERNYGLANLVSLCRECHDWVHANPQEARKTGFLVGSWDDPAKFPLEIRPGSFHVLLTEDGNYRQLSPVVLF